LVFPSPLFRTRYCKKLRQRSVQKVSEKRKNSLIKLTLDDYSFYQGT
jgi:hypothetical protein